MYFIWDYTGNYLVNNYLSVWTLHFIMFMLYCNKGSITHIICVHPPSGSHGTCTSWMGWLSITKATKQLNCVPVDCGGKPTWRRENLWTSPHWVQCRVTALTLEVWGSAVTHRATVLLSNKKLWFQRWQSCQLFMIFDITHGIKAHNCYKKLFIIANCDNGVCCPWIAMLFQKETRF